MNFSLDKTGTIATMTNTVCSTKLVVAKIPLRTKLLIEKEVKQVFKYFLFTFNGQGLYNPTLLSY